MARPKVHDGSPFTPGLLQVALATLKSTGSPVTTFRVGDTQFQVTLQQVGGKRVRSQAETLLMQRIAAGQETLTPAEARMAKRILKDAGQ